MSIGPAYLRLIASERVSTTTRAALRARGEPDDPRYHPVALSPEHLALLRRMVARIVPQAGPDPIDLAARIDAALAAGPGDGWRFADLPPDAAAMQAGLAMLQATGFAALDAGAQDGVLRQLEQGSLAGDLDAGQQRHWFEDVRAEAVKHYVAHPQTLGRIGYGGIGYGGDTPRLPGFQALEPGERETWEPVADPAP